MISLVKITFLALATRVDASNTGELTMRALPWTTQHGEDLDASITGKVRVASPYAFNPHLLTQVPDVVRQPWRQPTRVYAGRNGQFMPSYHPSMFDKRRAVQEIYSSPAHTKNFVRPVGEKVSAKEISALERQFAESADMDDTLLETEKVLPDLYNARTKSGRWRYIRLLGEGANAKIYHAFDMVGQLGDVAIKVCKTSGEQEEEAFKRLRAFLLHREAQRSISNLHNELSQTFDKESASLFAKYLEDHTGDWTPLGCFEEQCRLFEDPEFDWWTEPSNSNPVPAIPYVVMELVHGTTLHEALQASDTPVSEEDGRSIVARIAKGIGYLYRCGLIHRDIHANNVLVRRSKTGFLIKIIDLGFAIPADERHRRSSSPVVHSNWGAAGWVPPEVTALGSEANFELPAFSFDIYSLGNLVRQIGGYLSIDGTMHSLGLPQFVMTSIGSDPQYRPEPTVLEAILEAIH